MSENKVITQNHSVTIELAHSLKQNAELVFAYQMRDQIAVRGQVAVQKEFDSWFHNYVSNKLEQEAKAITGRIEQKKWNMVVELQKKFGYKYDEAVAQIFGKPLVQQPATQQNTKNAAAQQSKTIMQNAESSAYKGECHLQEENTMDQKEKAEKTAKILKSHIDAWLEGLCGRFQLISEIALTLQKFYFGDKNE